MLNPEAREIVRQAALEAFTRHLTPDEVFTEVVRLTRSAETPGQIEAIGRVIGQITALGKMLVAAGTPEPGPPSPAAPLGPTPDAGEAEEGPLQPEAQVA